MGAIDAVVHFASFFLPALGLGAISAALAKLVWRGELRAVRWMRLAGWSAGAAAAVLLAGLVVFGRDGMMATYAGMVVASAIAMMWAGFGARR
ncbi:MAG: hypothetical protein KA151_05175 [Piscinibacter sp.]|nr:hypothetical protein [Piscinibacter sp.]